jgi:hypothetical protein
MTPRPAYHPTKVLSHHDFFVSLKTQEEDILYSTAIIKFPISVQKNILAVHCLGTVTGGSILNVDFEGVNKSEYKADNGNEFVMLNDVAPVKKQKAI